MISFEDIRPRIKKFFQEGCETADYIMRVSKTPNKGIYAYEELGEIVRCKDCELRSTYSENEYELISVCRRIESNYLVRDDDFCAWGKRKEVG